MEKLVRVLIVEDMAADAELNMREARKVLANCEFVVVEREEDFLNALRDFTPHLVLSDYTMPEFDGLSALRLTLEHSPDTPVIMVTGSINEDTAVECMKAGAANYVIKHSIKRLGTAILHALDERQRKIDHRKAQQGLFESEKRYRSLFELSPVGVILQDADTKIINVNDAYCQISGFRKEELIGKSVSMLAGSENLNTIDENRNRILSGETLRHEVRNRTKTGTEIVIELYESAITLVDGSHGILSIAVDITEKKKNEEAIRKQADFQQRLIDAIPIPVFYKDINGDYLGCNSAFSELMGLSKEAILGKKVSDIYNPQFASIYYQADLELIRTGGSQTYEAPVAPTAGDIKEMLFNKATFPANDGSVGGIIGSMTDISELKGLEISLRQKNKDLEFLSDYAMKLSGVDADTNLNALITDELRSFTTAPLAMISGYIEKDKSLVPMHFSTDLADFENILDSLGSPQHNPFPIQIPDDYMQVLLSEPIIESNNLSELAFGQIPEEW
ncbi:MAG: PAS domain S-box protein, partial [Lentimicrobium sp.]|nr:PAS domain S-box protein [Lentimicrobium sp.]